MFWRWVVRRPLTVVLVASFAGWYLLQLYVLTVFGAGVATWWFYFSGGLSPGHLLAPISHNMANVGHLVANVAFLFVFGSFAEPRLGRRRYVVFLLMVSFASITLTNVLSSAFGTQWTFAGASGGILGLWAYISVRQRTIVGGSFNSASLGRLIEACIVVVGLLTPILVPSWELYLSGRMNLSHAVGVWLGFAAGLLEALPPVGKLFPD